MTSKTKLQDYTENEFLEFVRSIINIENIKSESELDRLVTIFDKIIEHPSGADLIYWPEAQGLDTPEQIVRIIKEWRAANGKPGFKSE
ncbi:Colicin-E9 immunity protein [compost metagenome]